MATYAGPHIIVEKTSQKSSSNQPPKTRVSSEEASPSGPMASGRVPTSSKGSPRSMRVRPSRPLTDQRKSCPISCATAGHQATRWKNSRGRKIGATWVGMNPVQMARSSSASWVAGRAVVSGRPSAWQKVTIGS